MLLGYLKSWVSQHSKFYILQIHKRTTSWLIQFNIWHSIFKIIRWPIFQARWKLWVVIGHVVIHTHNNGRISGCTSKDVKYCMKIWKVDRKVEITKYPIVDPQYNAYNEQPKWSFSQTLQSLIWTIYHFCFISEYPHAWNYCAH